MDLKLKEIGESGGDVLGDDGLLSTLNWKALGGLGVGE